MTETTANASQIGRFTLSRRLGRNAIATMYRARDPRDNTDVAIKLLHSTVNCAAVLQTIHDQHLDQVLHPAVCRLYSVDQHRGLSYLAYEFADGPSLAEIFARKGIRTRDKLPMMRALVEGLAAMHERGICHLGLTPARIKVTRENKPKILSIGRASLLDIAGESNMVKRTELRYLAPEQLETRAGDQRTDVFRMCLVLFEIISHKPAITPASMKEACEQIKTFAPAPDALGDSPAAMRLMAFLSKGLATDPGQRYPDAIQMLAAMPRFRAKRKPKAVARSNSRSATQPMATARQRVGHGDAEETAPCEADVHTETETVFAKDAAADSQDPVVDTKDVDEASNAIASVRESDAPGSSSTAEDPDATPATESSSGAEASRPEAADGDQTLAYVLDRLANSNDFPALSQSVFEVNQLTSLQANATVSQIAEVILRDYALSNKLLKLANSAYYGVRIEVTRVTDAIRLLGFEQVRITANGLAYTAKIGPGMEQLRDAMLKSFASGLVARQLADDVRLDDSEEAFLCAMFHDTGEHLTIHYLPQEHARIVDALRAGHQASKAEAAVQVLGLTFAALGAAVARSWRFPETIVTAIEGKTAEGEPLDDAQLLQLSWIARGANELCDLAGQFLPDESDTALQALTKRLQEHLPLDTTHLQHALHEAADKARALAPVLGIDADSSDYMQALAQWGPPPPVETPDTEAEFSPEHDDKDRHETLRSNVAS